MDKLCLHKIRPEKSDQAIGPELQNAFVVIIVIVNNDHNKASYFSLYKKIELSLIQNWKELLWLNKIILFINLNKNIKLKNFTKSQVLN